MILMFFAYFSFQMFMTVVVETSLVYWWHLQVHQNFIFHTVQPVHLGWALLPPFPM